MTSEKPKAKYMHVLLTVELYDSLCKRKIHKNQALYEVIQELLTRAELLEAETVDVSIIPKGNRVEVNKQQMMNDTESEIRELKNVIEELQSEIEVLNAELKEQRLISLKLETQLMIKR